MPEEAPKRRYPRREVDITLPPPYGDFHARVWVNHSREDWLGLGRGDADAYGRVVLSHDFVDCDDAPLPPPGDPDFVMRMPPELQSVLINAIRDQLGVLTKR